MDFQNSDSPSKIYLDDARPVPEGFIGVKNYSEFVQFINKNGLPHFISLDHDLGEEKSSFDCAKFLVNYCLDHHLELPKYTVHSQNLVGKENIEKLLENFNKRKSR